ncbi:MAG TPA: ankyrin repeat domain-containing protein [Blastocatellia bacterium]|jgi:ankyrin repeat protein|nr:ankyrin repeat domain-containing protein [Blastocatellia bacterium]
MKTRIARMVGIIVMMGLLSSLISHARQEDGGMDTKEFLNAVTSGEALKVKEWVKQDRSLARATDEKGVSAILLAVYYRRAEVVDVLLSVGFDLNIFEAAATGQTDRIRKLLKKDPELVNAFAPDGFYPLGLAIFFGHLETATLLMTSGAEVNMAAKNDLKVMPLHAAASSRQLDAARMLIKRGADVNSAHQAGYTALHAVAATGQLEFAELLLVSGADVNAKTDMGKTALTFAVEAGQPEMAALLRKHGARQ